MPIIETLLQPTLIYDKLVKTLISSGVLIHGMSHITGGGIVENLPRIIPEPLICIVR